MIFSLIMATLGRSKEVNDFIESLLQSDFDLSKVELIIVDQNKDIFLDEIVNKYINQIKIIHVKSDKVGLSYNRNLGVKYASGEILAFPDDDCCYEVSTLHSVYDKFQICECTYLGRVCSLGSGFHILRNWRDYSYDVKSLFDLCYRVSSITLFIPSINFVGFDEQFGVGACYGSCEDVDCVLTLFELGNKIRYCHDIIVLHPDIPPALDKLYKYSIGWGALYRKHLNSRMLFLWISVLIYHQLKLLTLITKPKQFKNKLMFIYGQIRGFMIYKPQKI